MHKLDSTSFPKWQRKIVASGKTVEPPRSYPGYPRVALPVRKRRRFVMSLSSALRRRRCESQLSCTQLKASVLSMILRSAHGITGEHGRGPTPSAGGLQSLELYLASWGDGWLAPGYYHYDRLAHHLSCISREADRATMERDWLPSLLTVSGGSLLWIVVGDGCRARSKYGDRAPNFLSLEAGHLMQSLCLLSTSVGATTVPLGGFYEGRLAAELQLPVEDIPLYVGLLGGTMGKRSV